MTDFPNLQRFIDAQQGIFDSALAEIRAGRKRTHWMWFIFPQLRGLGRSSTAQYYGIGSLDEAQAYLEHPLLGPRLLQCVDALLPWADKRSGEQIFGSVDTLKLRSSLSLFDQVDPGGRFADVLATFYCGKRDERTLALLNCEE